MQIQELIPSLLHHINKLFRQNLINLTSQHVYGPNSKSPKLACLLPAVPPHYDPWNPANLGPDMDRPESPASIRRRIHSGKRRLAAMAHAKNCRSPGIALGGPLPGFCPGGLDLLPARLAQR